MHSQKELMFNKLVMEWNKKLNLVSRRKNDVFDLIDDSKLFLRAIEAKENMNILDIGTGGGFPGVVLAIHLPKINFVLIDSIGKKINALKQITNILQLENTKILNCRAEDLAKQGKYVNHFDYIVARSVSSLSNLIVWARPLLKHRGKLITIKGNELQEEITEAQKKNTIQIVKMKYVNNDKKIISLSLT